MNDIEVVQAMAQMLGKVGIKVKVEVGEQSVYTTKWRQKQLLPVYMTAWGGAGVFDGDLLVNSLHSKSALSIYKNEALDKILEDAQGSNDPEKRKALYWKAQEMIYEDAPIIKAYQQAHIFGIRNRLDWTPWIDNMLFLYDAKLKQATPGSDFAFRTIFLPRRDVGRIVRKAKSDPDRSARMTTQFRRLFSPVKIGRREAKNRIVSTPHGAAFGEKGGLTDRYIRYHEEKAKGGCGTVMMFGSSSIHPTSVNDWGEVNNWDDSIIPQFRQMSDAIHRHGALCLSQISHRGRRGHSWYSGVPLWAPVRHPRGAAPRVAARHDEAGDPRGDRRLGRRRRAPPEGRLRRLRRPLLRRPSPRELPLAAHEQAHGRVRRQPREPAAASSARCCGPSATPSARSSSSASATAATTSCRAA